MAIVKSKNARRDIPLVSVIAVCYNHSKYVEETLDSILNQTYENIELIIIDSNSYDNSVEVIQNWIDRNGVECTFVKQTEARNINQNLNEGLRLSSGVYFQGISCDDYLYKDKINVQVNKMLKLGKKYALCYSAVDIVDENGIFQNRIFKLKSIPNTSLYESLSYGSIFYAPSVLIDTSAAMEVGKYDESLEYEDWDMALRLSKSGKLFIGIDERLAFYRINRFSMTNSYNKSYFLSRIRIAEREFKASSLDGFRKISVESSKKIIAKSLKFPHSIIRFIEWLNPNIFRYIILGLNPYMWLRRQTQLNPKS